VIDELAETEKAKSGLLLGALISEIAGLSRGFNCSAAGAYIKDMQIFFLEIR
jgi:hypothetical protein